MRSDYILFSLEPAYTEQDVEHLACDLGIGAKLVEGCYKGKKEASIFIATEDFTDNLRAKVEKFAGQESILHLFSTKHRGKYIAYLEIFKENSMKHLGILSEITKKEALAKESYTYDPLQDKYFGIIEA